MNPPARPAGEGRSPAQRLRPLLVPILLALLFRALCYAAMTAAAVWAERRPAPGALPDLVLGALPYLGWVARANYLLWLVAYVPLAGRSAWEAFFELLSPWGVFARGSAQAYLTKDLFFSGHTATTFLLLLYLWPHRRLRFIALGAHALVVASVLLSRLHYSIDVAGAWAVTFAVYALREWTPRAPSSGAARA